MRAIESAYTALGQKQEEGNHRWRASTEGALEVRVQQEV